MTWLLDACPALEDGYTAVDGYMMQSYGHQRIHSYAARRSGYTAGDVTMGNSKIALGNYGVIRGFVLINTLTAHLIIV